MGENKNSTSYEEMCLEKIVEILNSIHKKGENIDIVRFEKDCKKIEVDSSIN